VILNVTAGHVFREVRLGRMRERELSIGVLTTLPLPSEQPGVPVPVGETLSLHSIRCHGNEEVNRDAGSRSL
jgi:hypothetical protein